VRSIADIAVVGAGAAGIAAAISAARSGAKTVLLDARSGPGGTGGFSGLTSLCGLYDDAGNFLNDGFAREFAEALAERRSPTRLDAGPPHPQRAGPASGAPIKMGRVWVLPYRPERFRALANELISTTPNLEARWNCPVTEVRTEAGRIVSLNDLGVGAVIDCSGTAEVAQRIGAETLATDESTQAPAVIFPLTQVTKSLATAAEMTQALLPLARAGFPPLNLQATLTASEFTAKFAGRPEQVPQLLSFLRANVPGFEKCATPQTEFSVARRAGRMIVGEYVMTGDDVLSGRKFPDAVARGAWPMEQWDARGVVRFNYLSPGTHYEIPARALQAATVKNLFMAGKSISADVDAIASARVMGICFATGAAAGHRAASLLNSGALR
jgi:hypothetical protein